MELLIFDPRDFGFDALVARVRDALGDKAVEEIGGLYGLGDDVVAPWAEESTLFKVEGAGLVEIREGDHGVYVFADDMGVFDDDEVRRGVGLVARLQRGLLGFQSNSTMGSRIHQGPSRGLHFFCDADLDYPVAMDLGEVWALLGRAATWLHGSMARIQEYKGLNVDRVRLDVELDVVFAHAASADALAEPLAGGEVARVGPCAVRGRFIDRDLAWLRRLMSALPTEDVDVGALVLRVEWWGLSEGRRVDVFNVVAERRAMRPLVHVPAHAATRAFVSEVKAAFKGHTVELLELYEGEE